MFRALKKDFLGFHKAIFQSKQNSSQFISDSNKLKSKYDVVIIGAGHNG